MLLSERATYNSHLARLIRLEAGPPLLDDRPAVGYIPLAAFADELLYPPLAEAERPRVVDCCNLVAGNSKSRQRGREDVQRGRVRTAVDDKEELARSIVRMNVGVKVGRAEGFDVLIARKLSVGWVVMPKSVGSYKRRRGSS